MATITGTAEAETLVGTADADTFIGGGGDDTLEGGDGNDTVELNSAFSEASISFAQPPFVHVTTSEGTLRLDSVEVLSFTDTTVTVESLAPATSTGVEVFGNDFFSSSAIDLSRGGDGIGFRFGGPASQNTNNNNELYFTTVDGGRAYYQGQNLDGESGTVNSVLVDPTGGNTPHFGIQFLSQSLGTMKDANWLYYELFVFDGDDRMTGSYDADMLVGYAGDDTILGGNGDKEGYDVEFGPFELPLPSTIRAPGETSDPSFFKDDGDDVLEGEEGNDLIDGGTGDDTLLGGADDDELWGGGTGDDVLNGGTGDDTLHGGTGTDIAVFGVASTEFTGQELTGSLELISADGTDQVDEDVEQFQFTDGTLSYADVLRIINNSPPTGTVTIEGTPTEDEDLTAVANLEDEDGLGTLTFQWLRDGTPVDGATLATYTLTEDDVTATMSVTVSYTDDLGTEEAVESAATTEVEAAAEPEPEPIVGSDGPDTLVGTAGDDTIAGQGGNDSIEADGGNDNISGSDGDDTIDGGAGNDNIGGGPDNDSINGGDDQDTIGAGLGDDTADGGDGNDIVNGGGGNDSLTGGLGDDTMGASFGNDTVDGSDGDDSLGGGTGRDLLNGRAGDDFIGGGEGDDTVNGGEGNDFLAGGGRNDQIDGGAGNDTINGGDGDDTMTGGEGADVFVWNFFKDGDQDVITDFEDGIDSFRMVGVENVPGSGLAGKVAALNITDVAGGALIDYQGHTVLIEGVAAADLTVDDFTFL